MKKIKIVAVLVISVLMVTGLLTGCSLTIGSKTIDNNSDKYTAGNGEIKDKIDAVMIDWECGSVSVVKGSGKSILVEEQTTRDLADEYKVQWWVDGTTLRIKFDNISGIVLFNIGNEKQLTVTIPEDIDLSVLSISSASGDVYVEDENVGETNIGVASGNIIVGEIKTEKALLNTASGNVDIGKLDVSGRLSVDTASGNIDMDKVTANETKLNSASGKITIEEISTERITVDSASGKIKAKVSGCLEADFDSGSGNIIVEFTDMPNSLGVDTASGNVELTFPKNACFTANIDTASGKVHCDFPASFNGDRIVVGDGSSEINIDTASGNIDIYEK